MEAQLGDAGEGRYLSARASTTRPMAETCLSAPITGKTSACVFGWAIRLCCRPDEWLAVAAGDNHTCAIRTNGFVGCWGGNWDGQAAPPLGVFASISAGGDSHLRPPPRSVNVKCWGCDRGNAPEGKFSSVSVGDFHACAVRAEGTASSVGALVRRRSGYATRPCQFTVGERRQRSLPADFVLTVRSLLLGQTTGPRSISPTATPARFTVDRRRNQWSACGLRSDGTVDCWGSRFQRNQSHAGWRLRLGQRGLLACLRSPNRW